MSRVPSQTTVAVLLGGWSAEREVSLSSGKACTADDFGQLSIAEFGNIIDALMFDPLLLTIRFNNDAQPCHPGGMGDRVAADIEDRAGGRGVQIGADMPCRLGDHLTFEYPITDLYDRCGRCPDMLLQRHY